jgi:glutamate-1-semialdehyde aminotransferase
MYRALEKEVELYKKRTPRSHEAHTKAAKRVPLGVASHYRFYDPYPLFVAEGRAGHIRDLARAPTGRMRIVKMEGGYHGGHDGVSASVKPKSGQFGDAANPTPVISSAGTLPATTEYTLVAPSLA